MSNWPDNNIMEHLSEELKEALRALLAGIEEAAQKISKTFEEITDGMEAELDADMERIFWRRAAAFARSRMAARAQAFSRQMEHQKARQVMKRRKLLHAEGHFPDGILPGGKAA